MRLPRGSASTVLTLASGGLAAVAVGATALPMVGETAQRERQALLTRVTLVAELAALQLGDEPSDGAPTGEGAIDDEGLAPFAALEGVDRVVLADADGGMVPQSAAKEGRLVLERLDCDSDGVSAGLFLSPIGRELGAACVGIPGGRRLLVLAGADYRERVWEARQRTITLVLGLGSVVGLIVILGMRYLLSPVQVVSEAANRIASGEHGVRVEPRGPEEISDLALAVNALASAMDSREDEIRTRMMAVNELSSIVAHEVRNPLHSLSLLCELARTEPDTSKRNALIGKIEAEIVSLEGVVQRFLRNSGPLRISRLDVDAVAMLKRASAVAEPKARAKRVRLMVQAPGALTAWLDGSLVRRSIENLLLNAIEFAAREPPGHVTVNLITRGQNLVIVVDDDGPGVPPEARERIFEPYHSNKSGGTGLGLALVHKVVVAHGGTIRCEDSPLGGARFVATIPLVRPDGASET